MDRLILFGALQLASVIIAAVVAYRLARKKLGLTGEERRGLSNYKRQCIHCHRLCWNESREYFDGKNWAHQECHAKALKAVE